MKKKNTIKREILYIVHAMKSCLSHLINNCRWRQVLISFVIRLKYLVFVICVGRFVTLTAFICVCFTLSFLVVQLLFQRNSYFHTLKYFFEKYGCYHLSFFNFVSAQGEHNCSTSHSCDCHMKYNYRKNAFFLETLLIIWSDIWTQGDALNMQFWIDIYETCKKHFFKLYV